jgi:glutamyl/glutaminyl-tRNA synthetase
MMKAGRGIAQGPRVGHSCCMPAVNLGLLARRLPPSPLTRFGPSPTGYLHLGHVANAIFVWGIARTLGGRVLLRIEDHDRGRCRPEYEAAILEELEWLGLAPDIGPGGSSKPSPYRQSDSEADYAAALRRLSSTAQVYACECSRRTIARELGDVESRETPYPGRCRGRGLPPGPGRGMRLRLEPGAERFEDGALGP